MAKTLVLFYSRTGNTRKVAKAICAELDADLEEIHDAKPRTGLLRGWWRSIKEVRKELETDIQPTCRQLSDYDLVILGTPVWAGRMSSPLRTCLNRARTRIGDLAVFVTEGGNGGLTTIDQIAALVGKAPVASLIVRECELKSGAYRKACADFVERLARRKSSVPAKPGALAPA